MYINVPNEVDKIDFVGRIFKGETYSYILSDVTNSHIDQVCLLKSNGFYSNIVNVCDTYLFVVGNGTLKKPIKYDKINYLEKVLSFEYSLQRQNKKIIKMSIPSKIFTITPKERWFTGFVLNENRKDIDYIIEKNKPYLMGYRPYEKTMRFLCDNEENIGVTDYGMSLNILYNDYIYIYKDTSIDGYIIKYQHDKW